MNNAEKRMAERIEKICSALERKPGMGVPLLANNGLGALAYAGENYRHMMEEPEGYAEAMTKIYEELPVDCYLPRTAGYYPAADKAMEGSFRTKIAEDRTSLAREDRCLMEAEEYPRLRQDPQGFTANVLIPRAFPFLFTEGVGKAKKCLQAVVEDSLNMFFQFDSPLDERLANVYGILPFTTLFDMCPVPEPVIDKVVRCYRGKRGVLEDLAKHEEELAKTCEALWDAEGFQPVGASFPVVPVRPALLSQMTAVQFERFYWLYYKQCIEYLHKNGCRLLLMTDGSCVHILDYFRQVPKDSCILMVSGDDVCQVYDRIGDWQCVAGGISIEMLVSQSSEACVEEAKRILEHCAGKGGFIFTTDREWVPSKEMFEKLIPVYRFVSEHRV